MSGKINMSITNRMVDGIQFGGLIGAGGAVAFGAVGLLMGRAMHTGAVHTAKVLAACWGTSLFATGFAALLPKKDHNQIKVFVGMVSASCVSSILAMRHYQIIGKAGTITFSVLTTAVTALAIFIFSEDLNKRI